MKSLEEMKKIKVETIKLEFSFFFSFHNLYSAFTLHSIVFYRNSNTSFLADFLVTRHFTARSFSLSVHRLFVISYRLWTLSMFNRWWLQNNRSISKDRRHFLRAFIRKIVFTMMLRTDLTFIDVRLDRVAEFL